MNSITSDTEVGRRSASLVECKLNGRTDRIENNKQGVIMRRLRLLIYIGQQSRGAPTICGRRFIQGKLSEKVLWQETLLFVEGIKCSCKYFMIPILLKSAWKQIEECARSHVTRLFVCVISSSNLVFSINNYVFIRCCMSDIDSWMQTISN